MKVTAASSNVFQPVTLNITIESQEEMDFIRSMSLADISVPEAVSEYKSEEDSAKCIEIGGRFLRALYTALKGF